MIARRIILAVLALSLSLPASAAPKSTTIYKEVGAWTIRMDPGLSNNCYMAGLYEGSTAVRLGYTETGLYISLTNPKWQAIEENKVYAIELAFDGGAKTWNAPMTGMRIGGFPLLISKMNDPNFFTDFARYSQMKATMGKTQIANIELNDSDKAMAALTQCQNSDRTDPFAK